MILTQNPADYWAQVNELASALPSPVVHLISIETPQDKSHRAGVMVEQTPFYAAQNILDRTHRVATKEEIAKFEADILAAREKAKKALADTKIQNNTNITIDQALLDTLTETKKKGK